MEKHVTTPPPKTLVVKKKRSRIDAKSIDEAIQVRKKCKDAISLYNLGALLPFEKDRFWINNEEELMTATKIVDETNEFVGSSEWISRLLHPENEEMWNSSDELYSFIKTMQKELRLWKENEGQHIKNEFHAEALKDSIERAKTRRGKLFKLETVRNISQRKTNKRFVSSDSEGKLICRWCQGKNFNKIGNQAQCKQCDAWIDYDKETKSWKCLHE